DVFLPLNSDVVFENLSWLEQALNAFQEPEVAIVGSIEAPNTLQPDFGFGTPATAQWQLPRYAEGSVLLIRSAVAKRLGLFDPAFGLAYFEDADLSLRLQQAGWQLRLISIPHEHTRGSSVRTVPEGVRHSLIE